HVLQVVMHRIKIISFFIIFSFIFIPALGSAQNPFFAQIGQSFSDILNRSDNFQELENRISLIENEQQQEIAQRVIDALSDIQNRLFTNFLDSTENLEDISSGIENAINNFESSGADVSNARNLINNSTEEILSLKLLIQNQLNKDYLPDFSKDDSVGFILRQYRDNLYNDLQTTRETLLKARESLNTTLNSLASIEIPENEEQEQDESEDVNNWKTYTNEEYGFSFEYPNNWELRDGNRNSNIIARIVNPERAGIEDTDTPFEQFLIRNQHILCSGESNNNKQINLNGVPGSDTSWYIAKFAGLPVRNICFELNNQPISILMTAFDNSSREIMNDIFSSLEFTESETNQSSIIDMEIEGVVFKQNFENAYTKIVDVLTPNNPVWFEINVKNEGQKFEGIPTITIKNLTNDTQIGGIREPVILDSNEVATFRRSTASPYWAEFGINQIEYTLSIDGEVIDKEVFPIEYSSNKITLYYSNSSESFGSRFNYPSNWTAESGSDIVNFYDSSENNVAYFTCSVNSSFQTNAYDQETESRETKIKPLDNSTTDYLIKKVIYKPTDAFNESVETGSVFVSYKLEGDDDFNHQDSCGFIFQSEDFYDEGILDQIYSTLEIISKG
ncbi:MAG: PsbP-related protein, partial [Candidatus Paceibacterota bacterium]